MPEEVHNKRDAIIQTAFRLFAERGFDGTPTSLIAKESGVAVGTLFHHFASKEELINSAYVTAKSHMASSLKAGIDGESTIEGKAQRLWGNLIRWGVKNPDEFRFIEQFGCSPYITKITEEETMNDFDFLEEVFVEGMRKDAIRNVPDTLLMEWFFESNTAIIYRIIDGKNIENVDDLIKASFELIWRGMGKS